jgi:hypothetical protein
MLDAATTDLMPATAMLIESSVAEEPPEFVIAEARGADLGVEPPMGERAEVEEGQRFPRVS